MPDFTKNSIILNGQTFEINLINPNRTEGNWQKLEINDVFLIKARFNNLFFYEAYEQVKINPLRVIRSVDVIKKRSSYLSSHFCIKTK